MLYKYYAIADECYELVCDEQGEPVVYENKSDAIDNMGLDDNLIIIDVDVNDEDGKVNMRSYMTGTGLYRASFDDIKDLNNYIKRINDYL